MGAPSGAADTAAIPHAGVLTESVAMSLHASPVARRTVRHPKAGDIVQLGAIALVVQKVTKGRVETIGLRLAEELEPETPPATRVERAKRAIRRWWSRVVS